MAEKGGTTALGFVNKIEYATYKLDAEMRIIQIDDYFTKMTGYREDDLEDPGIYQATLIFEEDREEYFGMVQANIEKTGEAFMEHRVRCKDGSERYVFCLGHASAKEDGTPVFVIRTMDVTKLIFMRIQADRIRKENDDELEEWMKIANTDELTGVLRRSAFLPTVNELVKEGCNYALLIVDADDFKNVNDICDHAVGDEVLKALAKTFGAVVRDRDLICRMGGDEFVIFLQNIGTVKDARDVAERIISEVDKLQDVTERKVPVHVTIGGKVHNSKSGFNLQKMFREADEALYEAKKNGKNQCAIW